MQQPLKDADIRRLVMERIRTDVIIVVTVVISVGQETYQMHFLLDWWPTLASYRAMPVGKVDGDWYHARVPRISPPMRKAFCDALRDRYGVEHIFFDPHREQHTAVEKALTITVLRQ